jgi:hypothetical protein
MRLRFCWIVIFNFIVILTIAQYKPFDYSKENIDGKYCLIDENGTRITKYLYNKIEYLRNGFYLVKIDNQYGIIDYKGRMVVEAVYENLNFLNDTQITNIIERVDLKQSEYKRRYNPDWPAFSMNYGIASVKANKFIKHFENVNSCDFGKTLNYLALEIGGPSNWYNDYAMQFKYYPPTACPSNPLLSLSGFQINWLQGVNLVYVKDFDVLLSMGYGYGNLYFENDNQTFRNPNSSLGLRLNPRFIYKRMLIHASVEGWWDLSKSKWKGKSDIFIPGYKNTYIDFQIGLGFILYDRSSYIRIY